MTEKRPRTTTMNKRELMLLEKQLAFRTVKDSQRPSTGSFFTRSPSKNSFSQGSRDNNTSFTLPSITSSPSPSSSSQSPQKHSTMIDQELIATLSTKPISLRRKMQMKRKKNPAFDSQPDLLSLKPDTSYMKKGEKIDPTRHDGMTLSELYHFKKNDAWKNVFEGQAKADAMREMLERQQKEGKNGNYSQQLKRQLDDLHAREAEYTRSDVHFTQEYFGHRMFEKDEARKQANVAKIEGFRPLITADIAFKNKIREEEVLNDIQANEATLRRIHREIAMDEQKKLDKKLREKDQLARMTRENDALLVLKAKQKMVIEMEDRRINSQAIERAEREDKRRKDDFAAMMAKCAGGDLPGHKIVAALQRAKAEREEQFYQTLVTADNLINKQTQASEDIAKARRAKDGQGLSDDWEDMRKQREKQQMDDAERARQLVIYNASKVKEEEKKIALKKDGKRLAQMKYQKELEDQLSHLKYRTLEALAQTMSTVELGLNANLLKTTGVAGGTTGRGSKNN